MQNFFPQFSFCSFLIFFQSCKQESEMVNNNNNTTVALSISHDEFPVFFKEGSSLIDDMDFSSI